MVANNAGPFFFAWADPETDFNPVTHRVHNEATIISFKIEQEEGDFASLEITMKNPRIGLLNPGRKIWAWLSWDENWQRRGSFTPSMIPLFYGRLIGIPDGFVREQVTLSFIARPLDFADQKAAIASTLRTLPTYDPIFLNADAQASSDTVLEARPELWHIDRTSLEVSTSNIITGEDGVEEFQDSEIPYDSVDIRIAQVPSRTIQVTGRVGWTQTANGGFNLGTFNFMTYAGQSLFDGWPKTGDNIGGGWNVTLGQIVDNYALADKDATSTSVQWQNTAAKHASGDTLSISISSSKLLVDSPVLRTTLTSGGVSGTSEASSNSTTLAIPLWSLTGKLSIGYAAGRAREEIVAFNLKANFQDLITLPDDTDVIQIDISGADVGIEIPGEYGGPPIGNVTRRSYFSTDRGRQSLEYLILRARAQLLLASRAVEVSFSCKFDRALALSCRKNALIHDPRIPGGQAEGKIIKYTIQLDGSDGKAFGTATLAASIGNAGTVTETPGAPLYVEDGYVVDGYQARENQIVLIGAGDVGYTVPVDGPNDDGLVFPLTLSKALKSFTIHGSLDAQEAGIKEVVTVPQNTTFNPLILKQLEDRAIEVPKQVAALLKAAPIWVEMRLVNLEGSFDDLYEVDVTDLEMPKGIDLSAASSA